MTGDHEYQWSRPGCFKCKEPIGNQVYTEVKRHGLTRGESYNFCEKCFLPALGLLALGPPEDPVPPGPTQGRNVAV